MGKPEERPTVEQMLQLVEELTPEEREHFLDEVSLRELRRSISIGIEQADRGELIQGDEVFRRLRERNALMNQKNRP
ncbi:MAG: hypothetical protein U0103_29245 [Candidatus Obscuribacterales bacterium]